MNSTTQKKHGRLDVFDEEFDSDYWAERFNSEPYVRDTDEYDDFEPAYRFGTALREELDDFDAEEATLEKQWPGVRGDSTLTWRRAKDAVRAAWEWGEEDDEEGDYRDHSTGE
jgi:hypothetical protein